ncbi:MAG: endonuclease/exonuclease/phosphatase family protein [Muribaculaceae bacterium]|nr:endonuclease/exonuclease/phosphatase family protein [Muribaculaceae bacterium]
MKNFILSGILTIIACFPVTISAQAVKIMTYNVHNGIGLDKNRDHARIADVISSEKPDFVGIQEVDSMTNRSGNMFVLGDIAQKAGMEPTFAPAIPWDGGIYGIGLLSKTKPNKVKRVTLPGREEKRTMVIAEFDKYIIINTHLSLTPEDALESVKIIHEILPSLGSKPVILMGDLNSLPDSPVIKALQNDFTIVSPDNTPTFPANNPTERIDYIMISKGHNFNVTRAEVIDDRIASDHRPVIVEILPNK